MSRRLTIAPVLFFTLTALISSIGFIAGKGAGAYSAILAAAALLLYGIWRDRRLFLAAVITFAAAAVCTAFTGFIMDASYDGMYFHKEAVYALANGWTPLYTPLAAFDRFADCQDLALWLDNYPKGVWSLYAAFYDITGSIECAKGANILFVMALFFSAFDTVHTVFGLSGFKRAVISAAFAANPVILSQFFTFYNDLPVAALIMICAFCGMKIYADTADKYDYICLAAAFAASFSVKFTAPIFCGAVLLAYGAAVAVKTRGKGLLKPCVTVLIAAAIGVCIIGADPYIKHIANGQNPIYPVMGEGKYDIMNTNPPAGFEAMPRAKQLFISLFSRTEQDAGAQAKLKPPFSVGKDELEALAAADVRLGGFGVLFGGILLLCLPLLAACLVYLRRQSAAVPALIIFALLALFFPESWWARYNPYTYYIPCLITVWFFTGSKYKFFSTIISVLLILNGAISASAVYSYLHGETKHIQAQLEAISSDGRPVLLRINDFPSHAIWFSEAEIDYEVANGPIDNPLIFYRTTKYKFISE